MALRRKRHFVRQFVQPSDPGAGAWPAAWAARATAPATWLALGDSITEGQGASVFGNRWISQCLNALRSRPGSPSTVGGVGWIGAASLVVGPDSAWSSPTSPVPVAGGTASLFNYFWQTIDGKGSTTNATNDTITWTAKGTSVDTWIIDSSANGTYQIDANTPVALANTGNFPTLQIQHASMGASTTHTIQLKQTNAGLIGVDGIFVYDGDETNGVHLWGTGHYGALTTDLLSDWGTGEAHTFLKPFWAQQIAPDAVTVAFGTNEFLNNVDPAVFKVSMRNLVRLLQALPKVPTIYLLAMPTYDDGSTQTFRWTAYQAALSALALETSGVVYVDVSAVTGPPTVGGLFSSDRIHPSDAGHAVIGQYLAGILGGPASAQAPVTYPSMLHLPRLPVRPILLRSVADPAQPDFPPVVLVPPVPQRPAVPALSTLARSTADVVAPAGTPPVPLVGAVRSLPSPAALPVLAELLVETVPTPPELIIGAPGWRPFVAAPAVTRPTADPAPSTDTPTPVLAGRAPVVPASGVAVAVYAVRDVTSVQQSGGPPAVTVVPVGYVRGPLAPPAVAWSVADAAPAPPVPAVLAGAAPPALTRPAPATTTRPAAAVDEVRPSVLVAPAGARGAPAPGQLVRAAASPAPDAVRLPLIVPILRALAGAARALVGRSPDSRPPTYGSLSWTPAAAPTAAAGAEPAPSAAAHPTGAASLAADSTATATATAYPGGGPTLSGG